MEIINFRVDGELESLIKEYINRGLATSKSEVLRMALRELKKKENMKNEDQEIKQFAMENSNEDYWNDSKEDKTWNKYLRD